jgi:hypothetical protein
MIGALRGAEELVLPLLALVMPFGVRVFTDLIHLPWEGYEKALKDTGLRGGNVDVVEDFCQDHVIDYHISMSFSLSLSLDFST